MDVAVTDSADFDFLLTIDQVIARAREASERVFQAARSIRMD